MSVASNAQREQTAVYRDWAMAKPGETSSFPQEEPKSSNFPVRLYCLIAEAEKDGHESIISWQPHGRCFAIHKPKEFVKELLPLWFRQSKFESFQRQLNIYGFARVQSGRDRGCYYHECFLRGMDFLAHRIPRGTSRTNKTQHALRMPVAPDFYALPPLPTTSRNDSGCTSLLPVERESSSSKITMASVSATDLLPFGNKPATLSEQSSIRTSCLRGRTNARLGTISPPLSFESRMLVLEALERSKSRQRILATMKDLVLQDTKRQIERMIFLSNGERSTSSIVSAPLPAYAMPASFHGSASNTRIPLSAACPPFPVSGEMASRRNPASVPFRQMEAELHTSIYHSLKNELQK